VSKTRAVVEMALQLRQRIDDAHGKTVTAVAFNGFRGHIITAAEDGMVRAWDVDGILQGGTGSLAGNASEGSSFRGLGAMGAELGAGSSSSAGTSNDGAGSGGFVAHSGSVTAMLFCKQMRVMVTGGMDCVVRLWTPTGKLLQVGVIV
jgi:WD40 repeat protein